MVEFSAGSIEVLPPPSDKHQSIVALLYTIFSPTLSGRRQGAVYALRARLWDGKIREPDLIFRRRQTHGVRRICGRAQI
ncbi:MAG: Uma2 family endonuclease [Caldilineaceae bacterium]